MRPARGRVIRIHNCTSIDPGHRKSVVWMDRKMRIRMASWSPCAKRQFKLHSNRLNSKKVRVWALEGIRTNVHLYISWTFPTLCLERLDSFLSNKNKQMITRRMRGYFKHLNTYSTSLTWMYKRGDEKEFVNVLNGINKWKSLCECDIFHSRWSQGCSSSRLLLQETIGNGGAYDHSAASFVKQFSPFLCLSISISLYLAECDTSYFFEKCPLKKRNAKSLRH